MFARLTFALAAPLLLLGAPLVLAPQSGPRADNIYEREAVEAPASSFRNDAAREGDEIDREIERYFSSLDDGGADLDRRRLERLFGPDRSSGRSEAREEGAFSFNNAGDDADAPMASHTVARGDTIYAIGRRYGVKPDVILEHNPELRNRPLYIGEEILVMRDEGAARPVRQARYHRVASGDTLSEIGRRYGVSVASLRKWNNISGSHIQVGQNLKVGVTTSAPPGYSYANKFVWPLKGRITSGYGRRYNPFARGQRQYHKGIDIGAPMGTPFVAARDGIVIFSGRMGGYGNAIFVRHSDGFVSVYAHCKRNDVRVGEVVKQGQTIGLVGRTGMATGPHLHFEVRKRRTPINPITALRMRELVRKDQVAVRR